MTHIVPHRRLLISLVLVCGLLWLAGPAGRFFVIVPLVLFVPGYLFERILPLSHDYPLLVRPSIWLASSLSIIPLIYAWAWVIHLPLVTPLLAVALVACAAATLWLLWQRSWLPTGGWRRVQPIAIASAIVLTATLALRLYEIRNEAMPLWVDSIHHALLIRVVGETGAIPLSLRPYLPVDILPYHWGYHVVMSVIVQLSGLPLPEAMLWVGQLLNALEALAVAALAAALWRSNVAGLVAAVVVGLVSLMPAYLVTWGRYTLLDGLLILPPLVIITHDTLRRSTRATLSHVALLTAGLLLTHYIVSVFAIVLLPLLAFWHLVLGSRYVSIQAQPQQRIRTAGHILIRMFRVSVIQLALAGIAGALLAAPWLWTLIQQVFARYVNQPAGFIGGADYNGFDPGLLWAGQNRLLFVLAAFGLLLTLWRRQTIGLFLAAWPLLLLLLANPTVLGLPYIWLVTNTEVLVSLYIPVAVLIGGGAHMLWAIKYNEPDKELPKSILSWLDVSVIPSRTWHNALSTLLIVVGGMGAVGLRDVINDSTRIASAGDLEAVTWAARNTPPNARFLTSAAGWLSTAERGGDGGWWLVPLAGRWTTTPPVLFTYAAPEDVQAIRARTRLVAVAGPDQDAQIEAMMQRDQIGYVYVGNLPTSLKAASFDANPIYHRVYDHDGVVIFARR